DRDREARRLQPRATTGAARHLAHVALDLLVSATARGLRVASREPRDHALVARLVLPCAVVPVLVADEDLLLARPVEHRLLLCLLELLPRRARREADLLAHGFEHPSEVLAAVAAPRRDRAVVDRKVVVADDEL